LWPTVTLVDVFIGRDADYKPITQRASLLKVPDVAQMQ
jgi:hypothetical protein